MARNPVMFVVEVGAVLRTALAIADPSAFAWLVVVWLWATAVFANLAEAVAEGRGKAQAASLRRSRQETSARVLVGDRERLIPAGELKVDDCVVCEAGDAIPSDGDVIEGIASVDESAITGESAPSSGRPEATGRRSLAARACSRTGSWSGSRAKPGDTFLDRMIALVEGASRQKTPNEIALNILLASLTIVFLLAVVTLQPLAIFSGAPQIGDRAGLAAGLPDPHHDRGSAERDRHRRNATGSSSATCSRCRGGPVEAAGDVNTLLLDKTGTITLGNREAVELLPLAGVDADHPGERCAAVEPRRRDPRGPVDRGPGQAGVRAARPHDPAS